MLRSRGIFLFVFICIYCDIAAAANFTGHMQNSTPQKNGTERDSRILGLDTAQRLASSETPPSVSKIREDTQQTELPFDLLHEFLPMENSTTPDSIETDLTVGSGDGEILDVTVTEHNAITDPPTTPAVVTRVPEPRVTSTQVPMVTTMASTMDTLHINGTTTRSPMGMIKFRESRILESNDAESATASSVDHQNPRNQTLLPVLPEDRNRDDSKNVVDMSNMTPFTVPHKDLVKFLFSTLMTGAPNAATEAPTTEATRPTSTVQWARKTTGTKKYSFSGFKTTPTPTTSITERSMESSTSLPGLSTEKPQMADFDTTEKPAVLTTKTHVNEESATLIPEEASSTHPPPKLFWSDAPGLIAEDQKIFDIDNSFDTDIFNQGSLELFSRKNVSKEILSNLVSLVLRYVGQKKDFEFGELDKKLLAELILWPIIHPPSTGKHNSSVKNDIATSGRVARATDQQLSSAPSIPVLHYANPTPAVIDGLWIITFYVKYNQSDTAVVSRPEILNLCSSAQLKLLTKMSFQIVKIIPGLPVLPLNATDLSGPDSGTEFRPIFERFSSLFIPLIVLAAICTFVAVITVVCLVKKAQHSMQLENQKEKMLKHGDMLGVHNPMSDELIKAAAGERPASSSTIPAGSIMSAKEMYETEGWTVPMDPSNYPTLRRNQMEEDTKL